jgi:hypothetical protein
MLVTTILKNLTLKTPEETKRGEMMEKGNFHISINRKTQN